MSGKILHIAKGGTFTEPFIKFINDSFNSEEHRFLLTGGVVESEIVKFDNVSVSCGGIISKIILYLKMIVLMHKSNKIILHSLFDFRLVKILFFTPWLLKKCYWIIWGGDLYIYKIDKKDWKWQVKEFFRRPVIKHMGHLLTYIDGDVELVRKWYGAQGKHHECLMYGSNLYKDYQVSENKSKTVNIQIGNSADPSNNHIEVLEKLLPYKNQDICIYLPLSYGQVEYAESVIKKGNEWFGAKFKPLTKFMSFKEYLFFLGSVDIAIFNHRRQQAMGNTITLLGLGKTVYLRSDTTQWKFFEGKDLIIGDVEFFNSLDFLDVTNNKKIVKEYFSERNYRDQWLEIFEYS